MTPLWILVNFFLLSSTPILAFEYIIERVENVKRSNRGHIIFDVEVERVNHTDYALTGNVTFRSPFSRYPNTYFHTVNFYVSPSGNNNHHEKVPVRFPRVTNCEFMNTNYRKYFVRSYKPPVSHFPESEDGLNEELCNGFQADHDIIFYIHKFVIDKSIALPYVPNGLVKIETLFELDESVLAGIILVARVENDADSWRKKLWHTSH